MTYRVVKTYGNEKGLSTAFRQWKTDSHCKLIHGYSLGFRFIFEAETLDNRNWVYDFGNLEFVEEFLEENLRIVGTGKCLRQKFENKKSPPQANFFLEINKNRALLARRRRIIWDVLQGKNVIFCLRTNFSEVKF